VRKMLKDCSSLTTQSSSSVRATASGGPSAASLTGKDSSTTVSPCLTFSRCVASARNLLLLRGRARQSCSAGERERKMRIESSGLPGDEDDGAAGAGRDWEGEGRRAPGGVGGERGGDRRRGG
jgi:hypothetical protein